MPNEVLVDGVREFKFLMVLLITKYNKEQIRGAIPLIALVFKKPLIRSCDQRRIQLLGLRPLTTSRNMLR